MRERPIIFTGDRPALIASGVKTQTRRVVKVASDPDFDVLLAPCEIAAEVNGADPDYRWCKHGAPGDRLWVRERFLVAPAAGSSFGDAMMGRHVSVHYLDGSRRDVKRGGSITGGGVHVDLDSGVDPSRYGQWRTPLFMPRWASRLLLEITAVRVQRLQEISEEDAQAEGISRMSDAEFAILEQAARPDLVVKRFSSRTLFAAGWDQINGKHPGRSWADNPWVFAYTFKVVETIQ